MTNQELYIQAVKQCVSDNALRRVKRTRETTDEGFAYNGASTIAIAKELGVTYEFIRPKLEKLAKKGLLIRISCEVFCIWWPVGCLAEIKGIEL
jgi:hypothetical protein